MDFGLSLEKKTEKVLENETYDMLVIGAGPAGLNAALYAIRKGMKVGIIAGRIGGQVLDTSSVENYLGFKFETGMDLMHAFEEHVKEYKVPMNSDELVSEIIDGDVKTIKTDAGKSYLTKTIVLATGSKPRQLGVPGETEYLGRGVAYCAICDGPLFEGREVIVAGGGNSAVEAAIDLSKIASKVKLVHRSQFRADQILVDKLQSIENVEIFLETQITEVKGEMMMTHVVALDKKSGETIDIKSDGLFVEIGYLPKSEVFAGVVELTDRGEVVVNDKCETNVPGIFAAGDVTTVPYKQIIISASEGAKAALTANEYINKL